MLLAEHWCEEPTPSAKCNTEGPGRQRQISAATPDLALPLAQGCPSLPGTVGQRQGGRQQAPILEGWALCPAQNSVF